MKKHAYARVSARKQSRNGRSPIDLKKKLVAAELIVHQHRSYKEVSELTFSLIRSVVL